MIRTIPDGAELAVSTMERLHRLPIPWPYLFRGIERLGLGPRGPVVFECVGIPGILDEIITSAPFFSRVIVVGVCMGPDRIRPAMAINKELDLRFVLGYSPLDFRDTLHRLADGELNGEPSCHRARWAWTASMRLSTRWSRRRPRQGAHRPRCRGDSLIPER